MDFAVGDEVIYPMDYSMPDEPRIIDSWGTIVEMNKRVVCFKPYQHQMGMMWLFRDQLAHSPRSEKFMKNTFAKVLVSIKGAPIAMKTRKIKKQFALVLRDIIFSNIHASTG